MAINGLQHNNIFYNDVFLYYEYNYIAYAKDKYLANVYSFLHIKIYIHIIIHTII